MLILLLICINYFWYTNKNKRRNYFRSLVKPSTVFVIQRRCHAYSTPLSDATDQIHLGIRKTKEEWAATAQWRRGCWSSCCCVSVSLSMTMALFISSTFLCIKHFIVVMLIIGCFSENRAKPELDNMRMCFRRQPWLLVVVIAMIVLKNVNIIVCYFHHSNIYRHFLWFGNTEEKVSCTRLGIFK